MQAKTPTSRWNINISFGGVSNTEIMLLTTHLAVCLKSGLTLFEALEMLRDQAEGTLRVVLEDIVRDLQSGEPLHRALARYPKYFSSIYVNLVRIGEISGTLESNLLYLSRSLRQSYELRKKVKSAMIYPTVVFVAIILLGLAMGMLVLPKILPLFKSLNMKLSLPTKFLIYVAEMFQAYGGRIVAGTVLFLLFIFWLVGREFMKQILHRLYIFMPILKGMVVNVNMAMFCRTLGMLLENGISIDQGLRITASSTDNYAYRSVASSFVYQIQNGKKLSDVLATYPRYFPMMVARMIGMGERTGTLSTSLLYLAEYYESEVDTALKDIATIIEPILLIFIGGVVGTVAIAIIGPIYSIAGSVT